MNLARGFGSQALAKFIGPASEAVGGGGGGGRETKFNVVHVCMVTVNTGAQRTSRHACNQTQIMAKTAADQNTRR